MKRILMILVTIVLSLTIGQVAEVLREGTLEASASVVVEDTTTEEKVEAVEVVPTTDVWTPEACPEDYKKTINKAQENNPDVLGIVEVPAAGISEFILISKDNDDYLHLDAMGNASQAGSVILDCNSKKELDSTNTMLFGHNMKNGSVFGNLAKLMDKDLCLSDPYVYIYTKDYKYTYKVFSVHPTTASGDEFYVNLETGTDRYQEYLDTNKELSLFDVGTDVNNENEVVTLCTCYQTTVNKDSRLVVQAQLQK